MPFCPQDEESAQPDDLVVLGVGLRLELVEDGVVGLIVRRALFLLHLEQQVAVVVELARGHLLSRQELGVAASRMSTPRPAMLVATVTAPRRPAWATICASRSWFFAFKTLCSIPRRLRTPDKRSDFSIDTVPTSTGWPCSLRARMSSATAFHFSSSFL